MKKRTAPSSELSCIEGRYKDFYLTNASTMIGAYEVGGIDPSGLGDNEKRFSTLLLRSLLVNSPPDMTFTQYYIHRSKAEISIKPREDKRSSVVSKRRELHLQNKRKLSSSKLFFLPELKFAHDLTSFSSFDFLQNLVSYPVSKDARGYINMRLNERQNMIAYESDIEETYKSLSEEIETHISRLNLSSFNNKQLNSNELWGLIKALHTFEFDYLEMPNNPALTGLNNRVFDADIFPVTVGGNNYLKIAGVKPCYIRLATIKSFSDEYIQEALFASQTNGLVSVKGDYVVMTRYRGLSRSQQSKYFKGVEDEVSRSQTGAMDIVGGGKSNLEKQLSMSERDKQILDEVSSAMNSQDYHGFFESTVAIFGEDIEKINETSKSIRSSLNSSGVDIVWESAGIEAAFECFMPASQFESKRSMVLNSSKAAALSLYYKASDGVPTWSYASDKGEVTEEAFYIFESDDGSPFHYTPYIGGKCMVIGIGPIRSGKTFMKNTLATHFMKFKDSIYTAVDIDPGTEAVAKFFGDDGGIFRLDEAFKNGFNPFSVAKGEKDTAFMAHFNSQVVAMIATNSNEELSKITKKEQQQIDDAISAVLQLPKNMQSFASFLDHCNDDIRVKLSRFTGEGMYSSIYDNEVDAIGSLATRLSVYNIMGVKNDPVSLPLVMSEIVYRVLSTFENPNIRGLFKYLDIDEAHQFLSIPGMPEFVIKGIRTWGKWNAGVSLWTQSPLELKNIDAWPALRSAASTFWFMADGEMDRGMYRETFGLSEGHLDAISSLIPKQQAFIYQPEIKVAKVINLHAEAEQRVINTSVAGEVIVRDKYINRYGNDIDKAIQATIEELGF